MRNFIPKKPVGASKSQYPPDWPLCLCNHKGPVDKNKVWSMLIYFILVTQFESVNFQLACVSFIREKKEGKTVFFLAKVHANCKQLAFSRTLKMVDDFCILQQTLLRVIDKHPVTIGGVLWRTQKGLTIFHRFSNLPIAKNWHIWPGPKIIKVFFFFAIQVKHAKKREIMKHRPHFTTKQMYIYSHPLKTYPECTKLGFQMFRIDVSLL